MITVGNVKTCMKCIHTFGTGSHKRQVDITLLFQFTLYNIVRGTERKPIAYRFHFILHCSVPFEWRYNGGLKMLLRAYWEGDGCK